MERNTHGRESCEHGIAFVERRCFDCFPKAVKAEPLNPAPEPKPTPKGFLPQDFDIATEHASTKASKYSKGWHLARNAYLEGILHERKAKRV